MLVLGAGLPLTFAAMAKIIVGPVHPSDTGVAAGMNTVTRSPATSIPDKSALVTAFRTSTVAALGAASVAFFVTPRRPKPRLQAGK